MRVKVMDGWAEGFSGLEMLICRRWHRYVVPLIDIETLDGKAEVRMDDGKAEYLLHRYKNTWRIKTPQ